jgi:hypothetical protein
VLEVNAVTGPDAPLGRVISSKMIINGPMVMGYLESRGPYDWYAVRLGRALLWFSADTSLSTIVNGSEVSVCRRSREHNRSDVAEELKRLNRKRNSGDTHHLSNSAIRCWVLRLGAFPFGDKGQRDHEWLVLERSATQPELFERIGLGSLKDSQEAEVFGLETITTVAIV